MTSYQSFSPRIQRTIIGATIVQEVERFHLTSIPIITQWIISAAMILLDPLITSSRKLAMKLPYSYREKRTRKSRISARSKRTKRWNGRRKDGEGIAGKICPDKRAFFVEKFIITPGDRENNLTVIMHGLWVNRASLSQISASERGLMTVRSLNKYTSETIFIWITLENHLYASYKLWFSATRVFDYGFLYIKINGFFKISL